MLKVRLQTNEKRGDVFINPEASLNSALTDNGVTPNMTIYIDGVPVSKSDLAKTPTELGITTGAIISAIVKQDCANN